MSARLSGDPLLSLGVRFKRLSLIAAAIALALMFFGKTTWRFRPVPVDPAATAALVDYLARRGVAPETVRLRDQQGRCGHVAYGRSNFFFRYLVDDEGVVQFDPAGLLPDFEAQWQKSPCWYPPHGPFSKYR